MKITKRSLRKLIREYSELLPNELEDYGLEPGARETLTSYVPWINKGGLHYPPDLRTASIPPGTEVEIGYASEDGARIEVLDLRHSALFTVRTRDLIAATESI